MEHPFFRSEALRWLSMAENLLAAHDLLGSKSFASRAHHSDPTLFQTHQILAVLDTLLAAERRLGNNQPDFYAVLRLTPQQVCDVALLSDQYRRLVLLLNPQKNRFPFAEQAFRLVFDAYSVLSDPLRRSLYNKELAFYAQQQQQPFTHPLPALHQNFVFFGCGGSNPVGLHGGQIAGVGGSHSAQVYHAQPPVLGGSAREPHKFIGFTSGYNTSFDSGSGSKSGYQVISNEAQPSCSTFGVDGSSEQLNNSLQKQKLQNCSNVSDETIHNVNATDETIQNVNGNGNSLYVSENVHNVSGGENVQNVNVSENIQNVNVSENVHNVSAGENVHNVSAGENVQNVNVSENVGEKTETMEDKENVEVVDTTEEEEEEEVLVEKEVEEEEEEVLVEKELEEVEVEVEVEEEEEEEEEERVDSMLIGNESTLWTACPYCYYMYEYPSLYVDCTLKCQNCRKAFHAVVIPSPPPTVEGEDAYFCCWGFLPFGFSMEDWKKHNVGGSGWAPFTPPISCSQMGNNVNKGFGGARGSVPGDYTDNNEDIVTISDSSDSDKDWQDVRSNYEKHKAKKAKGKMATVTRGKRQCVSKGEAANAQCDVSPQDVELPKKLISEVSQKRVGWHGKNMGKLDLNVDLSVEAEEPATRTNRGNGSGCREDDIIEGNGFFEGLDEYLNSLPIINAVGDGKVVKAA